MNALEKYVERIKLGIFYREVGRDKDIQNAMDRLKGNDDFKQIQLFILKLKRMYEENALFEDDLKNNLASRHEVAGMMNIAALPDIVTIIREEKKGTLEKIKDKAEKLKEHKFTAGLSWPQKRRA